MIVARDLLEFLGIDIPFSNKQVEWDGRVIPFKSDLEEAQGLFHVDDADAVVAASDRIKQILDAKYQAADLDEVARYQTQLSSREQQKLLDLLHLCSMEP